MSVNKVDEGHLSRALACAEQAIGLSDPNPRVGCVLLDAAGVFLAEGHTQVAGGPHAEAFALRSLDASGRDKLRGGTAHVTLEPCSHHGRTPPCADALVASGVARVVIALLDPNPLVGGQGVARLREAGIVVDVLPADHPLALAARDLNIGFLSRMVRQRPWVRLKVAGSLDGRTALDNGDSQWITGPAARADGHVWRKRASAVLTGIGTVLADDPFMNVRGVHTHKQPIKVVLDTHWRTPVSSRLLSDLTHGASVWVYGSSSEPVDAARRDALAQAGVTVLSAPTQLHGGLDVGWVLRDLAQRGVNELHVEAGARLNGAFIQGGWVDEYLLYLAPKLIGPGRSLAALPALEGLAQAVSLRFVDVQRVGPDLRVRAQSENPVSF